MTHIYHQLPRRHRQLLVIISLVTAILFLLPSEDAEASRAMPDTPTLKIAQRYEVPLNRTDLPQDINTPADTISQPQLSYMTEKTQATDSTPAITVIEPPTLHWQTVTVASGDNLALIFEQAGFSPRTLHEITRDHRASKQLKKIMPGQIIKFGANDDGKLMTLEYQQNLINSLIINASDNGYNLTTQTRTLDTHEQLASAIIESSFWNAGINAGLEPNIILNLANIFGWDIDFGLDIRKGDYFNIIFEVKSLDGVEVKTGNILAAEFVNQGHSYQAIRHTDGQYYSATGRSMRKAFLRAPVNFKYISSRFNPRRLHPVTKRVKPHNGIDYAAKKGTPVQASGSGTVIASAYNKYNGNYIFIKHGEKYVTKYLHLSKKYVKKGAKVKQGQKIGAVGATGRVTGAHLHYEFLVNGVHRNPSTVKLPKALAISPQEKPSFLTMANHRMAQLHTNSRIMLAKNLE